MIGLKEATKNLDFGLSLIEKGRRAYRMMIEKRDNPERNPSARVLWERGYEQERQKFEAGLRDRGGRM